MSFPQATRSIANKTLLVLAGVLLFSGSVMAHPRHLSIAEAEWNAQTQRLEVALQVNPVDLEQALRRASNRPVDLDTSKGLDRLMHEYVTGSFVVTERDGTPAKLVWVGHEVDLKDAWLYFEVPLKAGPESATFGAVMFFELVPDQANTINFRLGQRRQSLTLTADRWEAMLGASTGGQ